MYLNHSCNFLLYCLSGITILHYPTSIHSFYKDSPKDSVHNWTNESLMLYHISKEGLLPINNVAFTLTMLTVINNHNIEKHRLLKIYAICLHFQEISLEVKRSCYLGSNRILLQQENQLFYNVTARKLLLSHLKTNKMFYEVVPMYMCLCFKNFSEWRFPSCQKLKCITQRTGLHWEHMTSGTRRIDCVSPLLLQLLRIY